MTPAFRSKLVHGRLVHRRFRPVEHRFAYPVSYGLFDLDELEDLDRRLPLFGYNRRALVSLNGADHLDGRPDLRAEVRRFHEERGAAPPEGRILLLTQPRVAGYVFNPVSFWYGYDRRDRLTSVMAEVNNTFGERFTYLLDGRTRADGGREVHDTPKEIFVSPFARKAGRFRFTFAPIGDGLSVHMDDFDADGRFLDATLAGRVVPLTARSFAAALLRYPLMPLSIIARIHLQAVRLWLRRVPHFKHEPLDETATPTRAAGGRGTGRDATSRPRRETPVTEPADPLRPVPSGGPR